MEKMSSISEVNKPHAVFIPFPAQGHINPMLKLAKILHQQGFHITFVNTEFNHRRLLKSNGPESLRGLPSFRFEAIPDGLPPTDADRTQDVSALSESTTTTCLGPFEDLLVKLNDAAASNAPPVSCIVSDGCMSFTLAAAEEFGVPEILFWTPSACGFLGYMHYPQLIEKGYTPLKDASYLSNGYLETVLDWIKGMPGIRLRDLPTIMRTTNPDEFMLKFAIQETERAKKASAIIMNTFDALEHQVLDALQSMLPSVYAIGPLPLLEQELVEDNNVKAIGSNLWKEDPTCIDWLNTKEPNSVVYVNFGSLTVMTPVQLVEFAWGLANTKKPFLWIIRPGLISGEVVVPLEFLEETKERGMLASWCPQEQVLIHPAIGGFLTHNGWNSTLESICAGVPMICWPFFVEQQTNCWYCCSHWGIGMEIENDVKREEVERLVRELMDGEKGEEMKRKAMEWKELAHDSATATAPKGSSYINLQQVINKLLLYPKC